MKKTLILYYSWSNGNTERIARELQKAMHADMERIDTVKPYTGSYNDVVDQGQREVNSGYKPAIKPLTHNIKDYDIIAIGTPTWWYTMTPAVKTLLEDNDFTGKTVIPFMTNGGWPGHVIKDMEKACNADQFVNAKEIQFDSEGGDHLVTKEKEIQTWLDQCSKTAEA